MNGIPSIFNEHIINLSILGGRESVPNAMMDISVLLINKSWSPLRSKMIENLVKCGFSEIISIESNLENYNLEEFSRKFPFVKILIPLENVTDGELINIALGEATSSYVLILRDSIDFSQDILTPTLAAKLTENEIFCVCPRLLGKGNFSFPILFSPSIKKATLNVISTSIVSDSSPNLFPFDNIALYNRKKFIDLGGFDYTINSHYWQNLDFSFRAWLWGEEIKLSTAFSLSYNTEIPVLETGASQFSNRFYLKNLVPRFRFDSAYIPASSFLAFWGSSSCGFFEALTRFKEARVWVEKNKYRFKRDTLNLLENWGN